MKNFILSRFYFLLLVCGTFAFFYSCTQENFEEVDVEISSESLQQKASKENHHRYILIFDENETGISAVDNSGSYSAAQKAMSEKALSVLAQLDVEPLKIVAVYSNSLKGMTLVLDDIQVKKLRGRKEIKSIEQDKYELFAPPCGHKNGSPCNGGEVQPNQEVPYGITRVGGVSSYSGTGVAWVIDSGIDIDHPDLNVDASRGFRGPEVAPLLLENPFDDDNGHGTHVAGIIGAINNEFGVVGVAPGATVIPVKVLGENGYGWWSDIIAGIDYVAGNAVPGDVVNMSIGGVVVQAVDDAVLAASQNGVWFTISAGNSSANSNDYSPARVNGDFILTVSAMDSNDNWALFSNYGNPPVDFVAPGVSVRSTYIYGLYTQMNGTSMAAPHAAGTILVNGAPGTDGTFVKGDPDGQPDPVVFNSSIKFSPVANFTYEPEGLTVQFWDSSYDPDGDIVSWSWNFGNGNSSSAQNPLHSFSEGNYKVSLMVSDNDGKTSSTSKDIVVSAETTAPGTIVLSATGSKEKGNWKASLEWTSNGVQGELDIYREGEIIDVTSNSGSYIDLTSFKGGGSLTYKICESGSETACSNEVTVQF
jgi:subtilisin family serine protease